MRDLATFSTLNETDAHIVFIGGYIDDFNYVGQD